MLAVPALLCLALLASCDRAPAPSKVNTSMPDIEQAQSVKRGPRFERTAAVGDGEEVSILLLPDPNMDLLDQRCLVYKNAKIGAVAVHCPNDFAAPEYEDEQLNDGCRLPGRYGDC